VLTAAKPFLIFPVIRHLSEVCILSDYGKNRYPPHYKTAFASSDIPYPHPLRYALRLPTSACYEERYGLTMFRMI
jgi:hypothetical protein